MLLSVAMRAWSESSWISSVAVLVASRNELVHASEQNLRCFVLSTFPHSVQVFGMGGCIPCHVRLGAGSAGRGE